MLYRSLRSIQPYGVVPAHSIKVPRVSMYSGSCSYLPDFAYGAFTLYGRLFQNRSAVRPILNAVRTPRCTHHGLGSAGFARRYFRHRCFFLFLRLLRCFSSPGSLPYVMDWRTDDGGSLRRVSPFRDLRIIGHLHLPAAFRSLSRLSSALSAKASTLRSSSLHPEKPVWFFIYRQLAYCLQATGFSLLTEMTCVISASDVLFG